MLWMVMMTMLRMTSETTELVSELKLAKNGIHTVFGLYLLYFQSVFVYFGRREMNGSDLLISKVTWESEIACVYQKLWSFGDETKIPICSSWLTGCCVWDGHVRRRDS